MLEFENKKREIEEKIKNLECEEKEIEKLPENQRLAIYLFDYCIASKDIDAVNAWEWEYELETYNSNSFDENNLWKKGEHEYALSKANSLLQKFKTFECAISALENYLFIKKIL